ncbi:MAG: tRNA preQ1(34) S-adenosylmethionine ribosyltransferase-isomerase QueA [bacterium]
MKTSEFDYQLPSDLIAMHPSEPRDSARLLVVNKESKNIKDSVFRELDQMLGINDVLVLNNSKVIPARLFGNLKDKIFELLLVKQVTENRWECFVRNGKKLIIGDILVFGEDLTGKYIKRNEEIFYFEFNYMGKELLEKISKVGEMPIPPYILKARHEKHDESVDDFDYQTVYAKAYGSVAAPTAGLHFTEDLLTRLMKRGVQIEYVTLHVGLGTFQPLNTDKVEDFAIHSEYYEISPDTAKRLNDAKIAGKRIIAVGTTSVRVLESAATDIKTCGFINSRGLKYALLPKSGETSIYIYPGYEYKFVDAMITNFHLPKSSLLLLVSAFASTELIKKSYEHAISEKYHFYSYGDAMFIC